MEVTTYAKLVDSQRELALRRRLYPQWVSSGRMTKKAAAHQIAVQEAIVADYVALNAAERSAPDKNDLFGRMA